MFTFEYARGHSWTECTIRTTVSETTMWLYCFTLSSVLCFIINSVTQKIHLNLRHYSGSLSKWTIRFCQKTWFCPLWRSFLHKIRIIKLFLFTVSYTKLRTYLNMRIIKTFLFNKQKWLQKNIANTNCSNFTFFTITKSNVWVMHH